jgi:GH25 family lysozyme M1 (1,4-beta-N-acetylmuramidase)
MTTVLGFDISRWQNQPETPQYVDMDKAKAAGIRFAFIKASQGTFTDRDFKNNWQNAKAAGLLRGAYHYLDWNYPIASQAAYFVNLLRADPGELPPVLDYESRVSVPARAAAERAARDFCEYVERELGVAPILYTSPSYWAEFGLSDLYWRKYPLWIAHYTTAAAPIVPQPWKGTDGQPGPGWTFWQYTSHGDGLKYGAESLNVDLNWWNGSEAELYAFAGITGEPEPPGKDEPMTENLYKQNALGYVARSVNDPGWGNTAFAFYVGYGCKLDGVEKPNDDLAPMERKAASLGKPFVIALDFTVKYYTGQQYPMDEAKWPAYNMDYPLQRFVSIASARQYQEIWLNFTDPMNHAGKPAGAATLDYTLRVFLKKVGEWAKTNKPGLKVRVFTNWAFMDTYVADGPPWLHNHPTGVKQAAAMPLDASYPNAAEKPGWLGAQAGGPFWWYTDRLVMFAGNAAALNDALGYKGGTTPPPPPPGDDDPSTGEYVKATDFAAYQQQVAALFAQMEARHAADIAALLAKIPTGLKYD